MKSSLLHMAITALAVIMAACGQQPIARIDRNI